MIRRGKALGLIICAGMIIMGWVLIEYRNYPTDFNAFLNTFVGIFVIITAVIGIILVLRKSN